MYGFEIESYINHDEYIMRYFHGVLGYYDISANNYITFPSSFIFNIGNHWVAAFIDKFQHGYYFDSFGLPPPTMVHHFLNTLCSKWTFNNYRLQTVESNYCGHYCLLLLRHLSQHREVEEFINIFKTVSELQKDDQINELFVRTYGISKISRVNQIVNCILINNSNVENRTVWK